MITHTKLIQTTKIGWVILVPKPGKGLWELKSYWSISLSSKLTPIKRLKNLRMKNHVFIETDQAFHKVWHIGLLYNINKMLSLSSFNPPKSYLELQNKNLLYQIRTILWLCRTYSSVNHLETTLLSNKTLINRSKFLWKLSNNSFSSEHNGG